MRHRPEYVAPMACLRTRDLTEPVMAIGVTDSGSFAVVADETIPPRAVGHALDYADRLAELIPEQTRRTMSDPEPGPAPLAEAQRRATLACAALTISLAANVTLVACAVPGL